MKVRKYILHAGAKSQWIVIPQGAEPLHLAAQGNAICLWMQVNPNEEKIKKEIFCVDTGGETIPPGAAHLGTAIMPSTDSVWHFFWYPQRGDVDNAKSN